MEQRRRIHKQQPVLARHLDSGFEFGMTLPDSATIIHVGLQGEGDAQKLTFWYMFDRAGHDDHPVSWRRFISVGTGEECEFVDPERHVATIFENRGGPGIYDDKGFVWHIFEIQWEMQK